MARKPSDDGAASVLIRVERASHKRLRQLALDLGTTVQALGVEALNDLLKKRGRAGTLRGYSSRKRQGARQ